MKECLEEFTNRMILFLIDPIKSLRPKREFPDAEEAMRQYERLEREKTQAKEELKLLEARIRLMREKKGPNHA